MEMTDAISIGRGFFYYALILSVPGLTLSLVLGLMISVFQAVTSIQEQTLTFVPRLLALSLMFSLIMPWMLKTMVYFATLMFWKAAEMGH